MERHGPHLRRAASVGAALLVCVIALSLVVLQPAISQTNEKKVRICHATASKTNPYISNEPAIANNGDLQGGHLNHTGPVFPADDWGDIIPPYTFTDDERQRGGLPRPELGRCRAGDLAVRLPSWACDPLRPIAECVEVGPDGGFLAHFGYDNPNKQTVVEPAGEHLPAARRRTGSSRPRSCPARMPTCSRSARRAEPNLASDRQPGDRDARLAALPGLDHDRQGAEPEQRRRQVHPRARWQAGRWRGGGRRRRHDRARSPSNPAPTPSVSRGRAIPTSRSTTSGSIVWAAESSSPRAAARVCRFR